jgi:uncharacterized protein YaaQ
MKLIFAIVSNDDSPKVSSALTKARFSITKLATTGGFLKAGNTTFICGVEDERLEEVLEIIRSQSKRRTQMVPTTTFYDAGLYAAYPVEVTVGGATIFVLDVAQFEKV